MKAALGCLFDLAIEWSPFEWVEALSSTGYLLRSAPRMRLHGEKVNPLSVKTEAFPS